MLVLKSLFVEWLYSNVLYCSLSAINSKILSKSSSRMPLIDALKAACCLLIVMHHLAMYGPMSNIAYPLLPVVIDGLREYGRIVVHMFFVISGFLLAAKLAPQGRSIVTHPMQLIQQRYVRLITPYLVALTVAIGCAAVARVWMSHDSIPSAPNFFQLLAHGLLLHNLLDQEALSAGVWYVAIDFQLFTLAVLLLWVCKHAQVQHPQWHVTSWLGCVLIFLFTVTSLFYFNRNTFWDETALYFFGSYGLGILAYWGTQSRYRWLWLTVLTGLIILAQMIDFRSRLAVAGGTVLLIGLIHYFDVLRHAYVPKYVTVIGRASYSIFLIHFPVTLVINAAFFKFLPHQPAVQLWGLVLAIGASVCVGILLFKGFEEQPVSKPLHIALPSGFLASGLLVMFAGV